MRGTEEQIQRTVAGRVDVNLRLVGPRYAPADPVAPGGANDLGDLRPGAGGTSCLSASARSNGRRSVTCSPERGAGVRASKGSDPSGDLRSCVGSIALARRVKCSRSATAIEANRRSYPRTVETGRPRANAIRRWPEPFAFSTSAAPINLCGVTASHQGVLWNQDVGRSARTADRPEPVAVAADQQADTDMSRVD